MEMILALPAEKLAPYLTHDGLIRGCEQELTALVEEEHCFLPRSAAETDLNYRQIIAYVTFCREDEVFCTRRLNRGGETRLHGLLSLGMGGHINDSDEEGDGGTFRRGLEWELREEAFFTPVGEPVPLGVIKDDSVEVGRYHLGFAFTLEVTDAAVRETEKLEGFWVKRSRLPTLRGQMETWSQIVMDAL